LREVLNVLLYMMHTDCQRRILPKEFLPRSTVQRHFYAWRAEDMWQWIHHELLMQARLADERKASPSAGIFDG
jgi:transposase